VNPGKGLLVTVPEFQALTRSNSQPILVMTPNRLVQDVWHNAGRIEPLWNESDFSIWEVPPANPAQSENQPSHVIAPFQP
jgi:hypothetical protein